jgi:DNA-binding response OmpR family regulator
MSDRPVTLILIVEDDRDIALSLQYALGREEGTTVQLAHDGESGLALARQLQPDLLLLDLNLPGIDGLTICETLRKDPATATIPIIMLTARVEEPDMLAGLDRGADDYITKPFSIKEVLARIRAVLRRAQTRADRSSLISAGGIEVDEARRRVLVEGREIALTRKEFDLLADLMRHPGRVSSRGQLLERVWGYNQPGMTRTVDVHVRQLRKKLGTPSAELIETVVGVGYRFRADE